MSLCWQRTVTLPPRRRGMHLVTGEIVRGMPELARVRAGILHVFIQHTSAGLTINENADADVRHDLAGALDKLAPENAGYRHDAEGPDDMPAHVKATLTGSSLSIPVGGGKLLLGTWQGIYLCEFRDAAHERSVVLTLSGVEG
jgi:secondary thiamine-phosphate synthase enzyme